MVFPHQEDKAEKPPPPKEFEIAYRGDAILKLGLRKDKCFLCKWVLQDLREQKKVTGKGDFGVDFPAHARIAHLMIERVIPWEGNEDKVRVHLEAMGFEERALENEMATWAKTYGKGA